MFGLKMWLILFLGFYSSALFCAIVSHKDFNIALKCLEKNGYSYWDFKERYSEAFSKELYENTSYLNKVSSVNTAWFSNKEVFQSNPVDPEESYKFMFEEIKPEYGVQILNENHENFLKREFEFYTKILNQGNSNKRDGFYIPYRASFSRTEDFERPSADHRLHFDSSESLMEYKVVMVVPLVGKGTVFLPRLYKSEQSSPPYWDQVNDFSMNDLVEGRSGNAFLFRGWSFNAKTKLFEGVLHDFPQNHYKKIEKRLAMVFFWVRASDSAKLF